jgi:hypothetical protein
MSKPKQQKALLFTNIKFIYLSILLVTFASCKKDLGQNLQENVGVSDKVSEWLNNQKANKKSNHNAKTSSTNLDANIELLEQNLDFEAAKSGEYDKESDVLIIPIKDGLKTKKGLPSSSTLQLYLSLDKLGNIKAGSVIYFLPKDGKIHPTISPENFRDILQKQRTKVDGVFKFLSITGKLLSQFEFKNGKLYSLGNVQKDGIEKAGTQRVIESCTAWYLVTTYFFDDGTTFQTREYIGTTCTHTCDSTEYPNNCEAQSEIDGGGGGGGTTEEEAEQGSTTMSSEFANYEDEDYSVSSSPDGGFFANPVTFDAHASWWYLAKLKQFYEVRIADVTANPSHLQYFDKYGRQCTRTVTPFNNRDRNWAQISVNQVYIQIRCSAQWFWIYQNGDVVHPRVTEHLVTKIGTHI